MREAGGYDYRDIFKYLKDFLISNDRFLKTINVILKEKKGKEYVDKSKIVFYSELVFKSPKVIKLFTEKIKRIIRNAKLLSIVGD